MPDCLVFVRVEPQQTPDKGAQREDVVSYRRGECATTNVIELLAGGELVGQILWETSKALELKTDSGKQLVQKSDIKEIHRKATPWEKKKFCIIKTPMTKAEMFQLRRDLRPRVSFVFSGPAPKNVEEATAWMAAEKVERDKLGNYGKKIELTTVNFTQKQLDNMDDVTKECEPIAKLKAIIKTKVAVARER